MNAKKRIALILAAVLVIGLFAACNNSETVQENNGSTGVGSGDIYSSGGEAISNVDASNLNTTNEMVDCVVIAVDDDSFSAGPFGTSSGTRTWLEYCAYAHLAYSPFTGAMLAADELELAAAKSVVKVDALTYDVEIYDCITDTEGNNITAADVVFSYDKLKEFGYYSTINMYYSSGEALDTYKLRIHLGDSSEGCIEAVLCNACICSQSWYEGASEDQVLNSPACTGAYKVVDFQAAHSVTLQARDDYWKSENLTTIELQNVKNIQMIAMTESDTRAIALENGEVDMAEVDVVAVPGFEATGNYVITRYANAMNDCLMFNCSDYSVCKDVNVRKAVAYALDFNTVYTLGFGNSEYQIHYDAAPNQGPDYLDEWDESDPYARNLETSAQYLEAAGYKAGELTVRLIVRTQAPQGPYQVMQQQLSEAGINCQILQYDRSVFNSYEADASAWDLDVTGTSVSSFTTTFWSALMDKANYGEERGTIGFAIDDKLQTLLAAACADRSSDNLNAFRNYYLIEQCYIVGMYNEGKTIVTVKGLVDCHMAKGDPTINAMTFTDDYVSVGLQG